jgi:hypothetical protein
MEEPETGAARTQTETKASPLQATYRQELGELQSQIPDTVSQHPDGQRWAAQEDSEQAVRGYDNNETQVEAARDKLRAATITDIPSPPGHASESAQRPRHIAAAIAPNLSPQQVADAGSRLNEANERLATHADIDAATAPSMIQRALGRLLGYRGRHRRK